MRPAQVSGFTITISPDRNLNERHVRYLLPEVCTTGKVISTWTDPLGPKPFPTELK